MCGLCKCLESFQSHPPNAPGGPRGSGCWAGRVCAAWVPSGLRPRLLSSNVLMVEINSPLDGCLRNRLPFFKVFAFFMCSFKRQFYLVKGNFTSRLSSFRLCVSDSSVIQKQTRDVRKDDIRPWQCEEVSPSSLQKTQVYNQNG